MPPRPSWAAPPRGSVASLEILPPSLLRLGIFTNLYLPHSLVRVGFLDPHSLAPQYYLNSDCTPGLPRASAAAPGFLRFDRAPAARAGLHSKIYCGQRQQYRPRPTGGGLQCRVWAQRGIEEVPEWIWIGCCRIGMGA